MKNRRRLLPHQTCDQLVSLNICRLRTAIYVSTFPPDFLSLSLLTCRKVHDILPDIGNIFQNPQKNSDSSDHPHSEITVSTDDVKKSELVIYTPLYSSRSFSFNLPATSSSEEHPNPNVIDYDGNDSPPPVDERIADIWNERRYRLLLTHNYHPSRKSINNVVLESSYSRCFFKLRYPFGILLLLKSVLLGICPNHKVAL